LPARHGDAIGQKRRHRFEPNLSRVSSARRTSKKDAPKLIVQPSIGAVDAIRGWGNLILIETNLQNPLADRGRPIEPANVIRLSSKARIMRILAAAVIIPAVAGAVAWGFIEIRQEREVETKRERAVKAPLRVLNANGAAVIKVNAEEQQRNGIQTTTL